VACIVVLFNLKNEADRAAYEQWARETDLPTVNGLRAVDEFSVWRAESMLGGEGTPPYQYIEIIRVNDMNAFGEEVATETMKEVARQFQGFAENPRFIVCEPLS